MSKASVCRVPPRMAAACAAALLFTAQAAAQSFPTRPVTLINPSTPGSGLDAVLRVLLPEAGKTLGQPVVMENRPGAQGRLGLQQQMRAKGDGHLLSMVNNGNVVTLPLIDPSFQVEPGRDYAPVINVGIVPFLLAVNSSVPFRDMGGLIAYAKAQGDSRNFTGGHGGAGGFLHIGLVILNEIGNFNLTAVAYKGSTPVVRALLANEVQVAFITPSNKPLIDSGKLVALAITSPQRLSMFPNVPTALEAGYPALNNLGSWNGLVAPPGTPRDAVLKLNAAFAGAMRQPEVVKIVAEQGFVSLTGSPEDMTRFVRGELVRMAPIIKRLGLKLE